MLDPATMLTAPEADPVIPPTLDELLHLGDLTSLGHWACWVLEAMGGSDIPGELGDLFAGDWREVARAGDALGGLGEFCTVAASGLREEGTVVGMSWHGPAAAATQGYLDELADRLATQAGHFAEIAEQYQRTAFGVHRLAQAVGGLVETVVDLAITAGLAVAAGATTWWTGAAAAAAAVGVSASIAQGARTIHRILEVMSQVWLACEALLGVIAGSLSALDGFRTVTLPGVHVPVAP